MMERPGVGAKRSITLKIDFTPEAGAEGVVESVDMEYVIKTSVPDRISRPITMMPTPTGDLIYNDVSPDQPRQSTLDEA